MSQNSQVLIIVYSASVVPLHRTIVIEQPSYVPWIGYFDLMRMADVWVWYDDVQYTKRDWRNRNRVAGGGAPSWLTVPVLTKGRFHQRICDVEIDDSRPWIAQHLQTLRHCYAHAPFFHDVFAVVAGALQAGYRRLSDLTIAMNESLSRLLGLSPVFLRSSDLPSIEGKRVDRLLSICRAVGGAVYLSGPSARAYIDPLAFEREGLELRYIRYDYPPYDRGAHPFVPRLSIVDALAWLGGAATASFLATHGHTEQEDVTA